jgi:glycosyltransferase involved in cell wall biosynthesis
MNAPRLAVIITCWNYEAYVARAIRSVVSQGCNACELVVIDDGSTDSSWQVIQREGVRAHRISNSGQQAACLYGLAQTQAPFVLFLDADDELAPGSLDTIVAKLDDGVSKLQFSLTRIDGDGKVISAPVPALDTFRDRHLAEYVLRTGVYPTPPTSGNVFRRDVCNLLHEVDYDRAVDGVILFAAPFMGDVVSLSQELGRYRIHDRNDSGLGRPLDPTSLRRDLRRFVDRMEHLRRILAAYDRAQDLAHPQETYFYLERSFYLAIAEGRRASSRDAFQLLRRLWHGYHPVKTKAAISLFFVLTMALPNGRARRGLAYRFEAGKRSTVGLLQALF